MNSIQKEQKRFDKDVARREKAEHGGKKKPERRTLDGWSPSSVQIGTQAYDRHLRTLNSQVLQGQKEMLFFADNMQEWADPKTAEGRARRWNETYCEYMINLCAGPVSSGLTGESAMESIGLCVGMALVSKDFRGRVNAHARNAMLPIAEKCAMNRAAFMDKMFPRKPKDGKEVMSRQEEVEGKYEVRRQRYQMALNGGRVPLTEEAAATKYLGFCKQAYDLMREDTPDMTDLRAQIADAKSKGEDMRVARLQGNLDVLEKQRNESVMNRFNTASKSLQTVAEMDGITPDMFRRSVHKVYGKLSDKYPEMDLMFNETAFGDVNKHWTYVTDKKTGKETRVWDGEFDRGDGTSFTDMFTPRKPYSREECVDKISSVYSNIYGHCNTMDEVAAVHENTQFAMLEPYFNRIIKDDLKHVAESEAPSMSMDDYMESVMNESCGRAAKLWMDESSEPSQKAAAQAAKEAKEQKRLDQEERVRQREDARDARDAAREAREQEMHEWKREKHEQSMRLDEKQAQQFHRQMSRIINTPAMQEMIAKKLSEGVLFNVSDFVTSGAYADGAGAEPEL